MLDVRSAGTLVLLRELSLRLLGGRGPRLAASLVAALALIKALGWPCAPRRSLRDKDVLITGAAGGLGRELARAFARQGARVLLWDLDEEGLRATQALLPAAARAGYAVVDVSKPEAVYAAAAAAASSLGGVDVLVNSAGLMGGRRLLQLADQRIAKAFEVNSLALFWTAKAFLPRMIEKRDGCIVTVGSGASLVGVAENMDYASSKHAAKGFNDSLRLELKKHGHRGIRTLGVYPGIIETPMAKGFHLPGVPAMSASWVAEQIVDGVRLGRCELYLPFTTLLGLYNVSLLPTAMFDWISSVCGASNVADQWDSSQQDSVFAKMSPLS